MDHSYAQVIHHGIQKDPGITGHSMASAILYNG